VGEQHIPYLCYDNMEYGTFICVTELTRGAGCPVDLVDLVWISIWPDLKILHPDLAGSKNFESEFDIEIFFVHGKASEDSCLSTFNSICSAHKMKSNDTELKI